MEIIYQTHRTYRTLIYYKTKENHRYMLILDSQEKETKWKFGVYDENLRVTSGEMYEYINGEFVNIKDKHKKETEGFLLLFSLMKHTPSVRLKVITTFVIPFVYKNLWENS